MSDYPDLCNNEPSCCKPELERRIRAAEGKPKTFDMSGRRVHRFFVLLTTLRRDDPTRINTTIVKICDTPYEAQEFLEGQEQWLLGFEYAEKVGNRKYEANGVIYYYTYQPAGIDV